MFPVYVNLFEFFIYYKHSNNLQFYVMFVKVIKAKFKLEDVVRENLCVPVLERRQCKDINEAAYKRKSGCKLLLFNKLI